MFDLVVHNARLYPMAGDARPAVEQCFAVVDGRIAGLGVDGPAERRFDARGHVVLPGFVDCHTHAVYAGDRLAEHNAKLGGTAYAQLARAGGGIATTVAAVHDASAATLVLESEPRLAALAGEGVTCVEIKSGYGLTLADELKMLRAATHLGERLGISVVRTFLGAHAVPAGREKQDYLDEVIGQMLPAVAEQGLADAVDIFVEGIAFDTDDMRRLFDRARALGLALRAHTEQLSHLGGTAAAAALGALSCDHLEYADMQDIEAMAAHGTVAVLLPGAFYFLRETRKPPVAALRAHGVPIAIATDLNPGSSPVASLLAVMHMGALLFGLTPEECLLGVTQHAARALGRGHNCGSLEAGKRADFSVWDLPAPEFLCYQLGGLSPRAVFVAGELL